MLGNLLILYLAAFPLMGSPGPATLSLAAVGSTYGFRKGLKYYVGIVLGTFAVLLLVATGVTGIILAEPRLAVVVSLLAAAYILYLAYKIATAPVGAAASTGALVPAFSGGFLLAIANPKAFAAIGAVYSSNTLIEGNVAFDNIAKISAIFVVILVVNIVWLAIGELLSVALRRPKTARAINIVFAVLLVVSVGTALASF